MQTDCSLEYENDAQNNYQILTQTLLFSTSTWSDSLLMAVPGNPTPKDGGRGIFDFFGGATWDIKHI